MSLRCTIAAIAACLTECTQSLKLARKSVSSFAFTRLWHHMPPSTIHAREMGDLLTLKWQHLRGPYP
eukprot:2095768-Amphidinium_carterae.1